MTSATDRGDGLRSLVLRGIAWKATSQVTVQLSRIVVAVLLARLLTPFDYGLAGMVLVFSSLILVFSDLGLGAALVQRAHLTEQDKSTAFWTSAGAGLAFTGLGIGLAGPIADFYGQPRVEPLFAAMSAGFLLSALDTTQAALLTRSMRFRALEVRVMLGTAAGAVAGIVVALEGGGAWAIIAQQLVSAGVSTALVWLVSGWRPLLAFSRESLRKVGGFGANVFGTSFFFYLNRNVDNLLVGRFLGAASLGVYALAYNVMLLPLSRLSYPIQDVFFPALARMQDDRERTAAIWVRVTRLVAAISMPAMLGLVVVAPDFVSVVLGEKWHAAVPVIRILAWVGLLQSLSTLNSRILTAQDRTGLLVRFAAASFAIYVVAFVVGLQFGVVGVAAAYAITATAIVQPVFLGLTARALGLRARKLPLELAGVAQAACLMAVVVLGTRLLLVGEGIPIGARLGIAIAVGLLVYLPALSWRAPEVLDELRRLRRRPRSSSGESSERPVPVS